MRGRLITLPGAIAVPAHASHLALSPSVRHRTTWAGRVELEPMSQTQETSVLDRMLDPLSRCLDAESARRVLELGVDPVVQARVKILAERANEGLLTPEERAEYEAYINADDFIAILKSKARRRLDS